MAKDYLKIYGVNKSVKFQQGGEIPAQGEGGQPAEGSQPAGAEAQGRGHGQTSFEDLIRQVVQTQDKDLALKIVMMIAQQMGLIGGGAPQQQAPMGRYGMRIPVFNKAAL